MPAHHQPDFTVDYLADDALPVLSVAGELDVATAPVLRKAFLELLGNEPVPDVAVDLSGVTFLDSSGLGVLLMGARRWADEQRRMVVRNPSRAAERVIDLTGVRRAFEFEV